MTQQEALFEFILRIGDNALIIGHRLSELCSHGPILEEDIATTNIALDHIGQARTLLTYAGQTEGIGRNEDHLAYQRDQHEFRNAMLTEQDNGDFGVTTARQFMYSSFAWLMLNELKKSKDLTLAGYAEKAIKETAYHVRHSSEWVIRLGDGTDESKERIQAAFNDLWMFTDDLFETTDGDRMLADAGIGVNFESLRGAWDEMMKELMQKATLTIPEKKFQMKGSRNGKHSEHLSYLLGEMQYLQRTMPGLEW